MSVRSRLLFNHDYTYKIGTDPDGFVRALLSYLHGGMGKEALESLYDIRVEWQGHHSELDDEAHR